MLNQFNVSLWGDEAFSAILSMKSIPDIVKTIIHDTSPPLYNILEHLWFGVFGTSEVAVRALSFLFFLIAVFFVYKIGTYLWDRNTGFLAAALTFLNTFLFAYGFEGRMYSLLLATVTASFYFFIRKKWLGYVIATTLALYTHHFAIFAVFVQGLWFFKELLWGSKKVAFSMLKSFIAVAVLYSPWLIPFYNQTKMVAGGFWLGKPSFKNLGELVLKYLSFGLIPLVLRKWHKDLPKTPVLVAWFAVPILATWLISQKLQSIFFDRYLLYAIPAAMLLAASEGRRISKIAFIVVLIAYLSADVFYFTHPTKLPFRDLAQFALSTKKGDDYLVNWNGASHHLWESKYYRLNAPIYLTSKEALPFFVGTALMAPEDLVYSIPKNTFRVGVITSGPVAEVKIPNYTRADVHTFGELKLIWLEK